MFISTPTKPGNKTHILVVPFPAQGHMIPLIDFIHHLSTLTPTTTITILTTPKNLHLLTPLLTTTNNNIIPLILPFPATSSASTPEHVQGLPPNAVRQFIPTLSLLLPSLRLWFESHPSPPTLIISDFFAGWMHRFAIEMGIKRVVFSPSGGFMLSLMYSLWTNMPKKRNDDVQEDDVVLFRDVPNCPKYPWRQLSYMYRSYVEGDADSEFIKKCFIDDMASWGLVVNSFDGLERVYLDHLMDVLGHDRVWAVGPLLSPRGIDSRGGSSAVDLDFISGWLDTCGDIKVVYVSFGTQALLSTRQTEVVAEALEASGIRFIWSVRDPLPTAGDDSVLHGFEDRVACRGMVIKGWAPQVAILKHKAIGTFFTHCGWNSILEGLIAGVGMLAWPMGADQYANATLIVDQLKVGVRVCEGPETVPDPNSLARIIAESVNGDILDRKLIEKLHADCLEAVSENGSSSKALAQLVNKLTE
ncbi:flavonol 3-O-glucosyltransferase UGT89B1-like [Silene latifolia]|uniref:flavonol 3-O-glucosyltransferase UGT89B1-like n=1 Tax=Silene latifolia TaxID=37657 RepID=UPI003D77D0C7